MVYECGLRLAAICGLSLVVQVSGGALARTSSVAPPIKINSKLRDNRVDTISRAGLTALLFFAMAYVRISRMTNPIEQSFELAAGRCADITPLVYRRLHLSHPE